ncbi:MAG: response regulator transcription factor, partial [Candidatus Onthovivens sp.]|nr:response regulator transcription factor [Candidatus Onthovivens sp.]
KGSEFNKVALLNEGADDYLVKPFGMMELVARVNAVLRRITKEKQVVLSNGNIKVDLEKHEAYVDNKEIVLTLKEYDLLVYFLSNLNKVISRDELIEKVWGVDFIGESRTIDVHVGTLRSKISSSNSVIQTVRGVGYRMEKLNEKEN